MLAARWIGAEPIVGRSLMLSTASLSSLSHEHNADPTIRLWNDTAHVLTSHGHERVLHSSAGSTDNSPSARQEDAVN
jgi:hypothetical protein